jgi:hypothetical protein
VTRFAVLIPLCRGLESTCLLAAQLLSFGYFPLF